MLGFDKGRRALVGILVGLNILALMFATRELEVSYLWGFAILVVATALVGLIDTVRIVDMKETA